MHEPRSKLILSANHMDAIICPLVMVDLDGIRLGMGAATMTAHLQKAKTA